MKLLLLLSDEAQIAHRRDVELKIVQEERDDAKTKATALLDELSKKPHSRGQWKSASYLPEGVQVLTGYSSYEPLPG